MPTLKDFSAPTRNLSDLAQSLRMSPRAISRLVRRFRRELLQHGDLIAAEMMPFAEGEGAFPDYALNATQSVLLLMVAERPGARAVRRSLLTLLASVSPSGLASALAPVIQASARHCHGHVSALYREGVEWR